MPQREDTGGGRQWETEGRRDKGEKTEQRGYDVGWQRGREEARYEGGSGMEDGGGDNCRPLSEPAEILSQRELGVGGGGGGA